MKNESAEGTLPAGERTPGRVDDEKARKDQ